MQKMEGRERVPQGAHLQGWFGDMVQGMCQQVSEAAVGREKLKAHKSKEGVERFSAVEYCENIAIEL
jgi:hypothetical protein